MEDKFRIYKKRFAKEKKVAEDRVRVALIYNIDGSHYFHYTVLDKKL